MKAHVIEQYGKAPLKMVEVPIPEVGEYDVLAEIHSASLNPVDFKIRDGKLKVLLKYDMPLILGSDFSGIVTQVGSKVSRFKVGDEIYSKTPKNQMGTWAEFVAVREDAIALKPANLTFEEAAAIPLVGLTSYQVLHDVLEVKKGQRLLIQAGSGGVGTFAIQLAKEMGAYVATTVSDAGVDLVKSLGADKVINYKAEKFEDVLSDYDAVYDTLGGEFLEKAFRIVKPGGNIVSISGLPNARFGKEYGVGIIKTGFFSLISRKLTQLEKQYGVRYTFLFMSHSGKQLQIIGELIEKGKIKPVVDRVFPFNEAQDAVQYIESGRAKGKVVIKIK